MLRTKLTSPVASQPRARFSHGMVSEHADEFTEWLHQCGYKPGTIADLMRSLAAWTDWMREAEFVQTDVREGFEAYKQQLNRRTESGHRRDINQWRLGAPSKFIRFLQDQGVIENDEPLPSSTTLWPLLGEFRTWMLEHRGLTKSTLDIYEGVLIGIVETIGIIPSLYTPEKLRNFVLQRARPHGVGRAGTIVTAVRAFLRFLGATERCPVGMEYAIPGFASRRLSSVPKFLRPADVEQLIGSCADDRVGLRDKAVLLLLARLGLRASEVAHLKFADIDWVNGKVIVCGKGRHQEWLPLPQEVGDSILSYLQEARPPLAVTEIFTTVVAPLRPLSRLAVTCIVRSALRRTGIKAPINGAHVLRHSAAAAMLHQGMSLAGIGAVLRHRSPDTTGHYAKVDLRLLAEIAQPWPEGPSC
jgi:integrase/recombinase XerD